MVKALLRRCLPQSIHLTYRLARQLRQQLGQHVASGPFRSYHCSAQAVGSVQLPKLLGTYELELHETVERICMAAPTHIIIAGAAEGYYVSGFARRLPQCLIVAYEADPTGRELLRANLAANEVDAGRIGVEGICTVTALRKNLQTAGEMAWVIMDIEGGEAILADPEAIPELLHTHLLIEVHEFAIPGLSAVLQGRFERSHDVREIRAWPRTMDDFPPALGSQIGGRFAGAAVALMDERRPPGMSWLVMTAQPQ